MVAVSNSIPARRGNISTVLSQFGPPVVQGRTAVDGVSSAPARLLRVKEVAAFLGVSTATVYRLCEEGALPHLRVINSIRIISATLKAFLEKAT